MFQLAPNKTFGAFCSYCIPNLNIHHFHLNRKEMLELQQSPKMWKYTFFYIFASQPFSLLNFGAHKETENAGGFNYTLVITVHPPEITPCRASFGQLLILLQSFAEISLGCAYCGSSNGALRPQVCEMAPARVLIMHGRKKESCETQPLRSSYSLESCPHVSNVGFLRLRAKEIHSPSLLLCNNNFPLIWK